MEWEPRDYAAVVASTVSLLALAWSFRSFTLSRERGELQEHFDKDVRDVLHERFENLRELSTEIIEPLGKLALPDSDTPTDEQWAKAAVVLDRARSFKFWPLQREISNLVQRAVNRYGHLIGLHFYWAQYFPGGVKANRRADEWYERIEQSGDMVTEKLSDILEAIRKRNTNLLYKGIDDYQSQVFLFEGDVRVFLNEIRAAVVTRRSLDELHNS